jgi:hypothetical protein
MAKHPNTPPDFPPGEKTQVLGQEELHPALEARSEQAAGQATTIIPAGQPVLETPPPSAEDLTQPLPQVPSDPDTDQAVEVPAIVVGPDATVAMTAGAAALPEDWEATQALRAGEPTPPPPDSTQALPTGLPGIPNPAATQVMPAGLPRAPQDGNIKTRPLGARTVAIPSDQLPALARKGMPLWGWAGLATVALGLTAGGLYFLRPDLLGLGNSGSSDTHNPEGASPRAFAKTHDPAPEIPPALRPYLEKAEKGDAAAMRMLGVMYYNGLNVPRNQQEGLKWYRKAADAGSNAAQKELKLLEGKVLPQ